MCPSSVHTSKINRRHLFSDLVTSQYSCDNIPKKTISETSVSHGSTKKIEKKRVSENRGGSDKVLKSPLFAKNRLENVIWQKRCSEFLPSLQTLGGWLIFFIYTVYVIHNFLGCGTLVAETNDVSFKQPDVFYDYL
jgi:hypothetical protein